jgi:hypothetical protein
LGKKASSEKDPFRFGNISRRLTLSSRNRAKGGIAKDRFAFDQSMQGNDCTKIRKNGDFVVQKRDFFGNKIGDPTIYEVKTDNSKLTEAQEKRKRQLGKDRYKVVRY